LGGNPAIAGNDEISSGVSWRLSRAARYPSKPRLILTRTVGIEIDAQTRYATIAKLEDVAERPPGVLPPAHDLPDISPCEVPSTMR
jgi:hypothetical protein